MSAARVLAGVVVASFLLLSADPAAADQDARPSPPGVASNSAASQPQSQSPPNRTADFLFGRPKVSLGVRGDWVFASAGSDIFDFVTRHLTIDKKDFDTAGFSADGGFALSPRADVVVGFEWNRVERASEYRDYVDNRLEPIEQTTGLKTWHIFGSFRYAVTPKGRDISRLAWIPSRIIPYVGAGGGVTYYQFRQFGDFVDFQDLSVFAESFRSSGWTPTVHGFGGVDVRLYKGLYGSFQGRYTKAAGKLGSDFIDFDPIDLSGFRVSAGINLLF
jgi:hypothetical protein